MATLDYSDEEWRAIPSVPEYAVSSLGRVKRVVQNLNGHAAKILALNTDRGGYGYVGLFVHGKIKTRKIHRLVCEAFHGEAPSPQHHAAHFDGVKTNNTPANLYWATPKQNAADRERHGTVARGARSGARLHPERWSRGDDHWTRKHPERVPRGDNHARRARPEINKRGEECHSSKLTEEQVRAILATPKTHGSGKALAERYGVTMGLISAIRKGRVWGHLTP